MPTQKIYYRDEVGVVIRKVWGTSDEVDRSRNISLIHVDVEQMLPHLPVLRVFLQALNEQLKGFVHCSKVKNLKNRKCFPKRILAETHALVTLRGIDFWSWHQNCAFLILLASDSCLLPLIHSEKETHSLSHFLEVFFRSSDRQIAILFENSGSGQFFSF